MLYYHRIQPTRLLNVRAQALVDQPETGIDFELLHGSVSLYLTTLRDNTTKNLPEYPAPDRPLQRSPWMYFFTSLKELFFRKRDVNGLHHQSGVHSFPLGWRKRFNWANFGPVGRPNGYDHQLGTNWESLQPQPIHGWFLVSTVFEISLTLGLPELKKHEKTHCKTTCPCFFKRDLRFWCSLFHVSWFQPVGELVVSRDDLDPALRFERPKLVATSHGPPDISPFHPMSIKTSKHYIWMYDFRIHPYLNHVKTWCTWKNTWFSSFNMVFVSATDFGLYPKIPKGSLGPTVERSNPWSVQVPSTWWQCLPIDPKRLGAFLKRPPRMSQELFQLTMES